MALEAFVHWDPNSDDFVLFLLDRDHRRIWEPSAAGVEVREMTQNTENKPLLRLPSNLWPLIGAALRDTGLVPSKEPAQEPPAVRAHLADTIAVRDRLLALVERRR